MFGSAGDLAYPFLARRKDYKTDSVAAGGRSRVEFEDRVTWRRLPREISMEGRKRSDPTGVARQSYPLVTVWLP
jgi:hypothetical protein